MKEIAYERIQARSPEGTSLEIVLAVGAPYQMDDVEWACPVSLEPLHENLREIHGVSSLQSLCLALSLAKCLLDGFVEAGGQLFHENGEAYALDALFGKAWNKE